MKLPEIKKMASDYNILLNNNGKNKNKKTLIMELIQKTI
jgi:hypothetical protein